ncbi:MAG TPA: hypothetical protein DEF39_00180 [Hungateiclostridium thermocellum]|nr:hypothetical protein Clo1313_1974 [Acetivibrio thermocellus DSM 1313]ALX08989.1 hypothetical protein AD2_01999 [Acetivibrio thermocellus AD2]ANV76739.1 hypothetical protein LQRI_1998 [Acetivibrio thermocellus DSM 2360]EIC05070.1 hypothetical protein YSBL_1294 [Acetivibrio thermocellus YS]THJ78081.1 hypothetical protein EPD62_08125 [Acetivibrio thermocellus]CDG34932.1 hypothetical protein CTHBC1_0260 [Acetivibrio thermocellus BC1]
MKVWTLSARILLSIAAYVLSYILFVCSSIYWDLVFLFKTQSRVFIIINIVAFIIIGLCYNKFEKAVGVICMLFAAPSVLVHSKMLKSEPAESVYTRYFPLHLTALLFLIITVLLMAAIRLQKLDRQYDEMISGGASEADVKLIILNNIKVYSVFLAVILFSGFVLVALAFAMSKIKATRLTVIITVTTGVVLVLGCVLYLYRKWTKK